MRLRTKRGRPMRDPSMGGGSPGALRSRADRVLVPVEEDLAVRVLSLELRNACEDLFERGGFVIGIDPEVHGLFRPSGRRPRTAHGVPRRNEREGSSKREPLPPEGPVAPKDIRRRRRFRALRF